MYVEVYVCVCVSVCFRVYFSVCLLITISDEFHSELAVTSVTSQAQVTTICRSTTGQRRIMIFLWERAPFKMFSSLLAFIFQNVCDVVCTSFLCLGATRTD